MSFVQGKSGLQMQVRLTTETPDGKQTTTKFDFELNVAEQRAIVERDSGGPCFRMWLTEDEKEAIAFADWTCYRLKDGRYAVWRKESDLEDLKKMGEMAVYKGIMARRIYDDSIE